MEAFFVRQANRQDSQPIWEIRNHPLIRRFSTNDEEISLTEHREWFEKKYFSGEDSHCFVLESKESQTVGYCRLDFDGQRNDYRISIALDPNFHGRGLGYKLLSETLRQFSTDKEIFAEIQKNNLPSLKLFLKNNFKVVRENKKNYYLEFKNSDMESGRKTIFIIVTRGFLIRNILRSGVLELLKKSNYRIVIFFNMIEVPHHLHREFEDKQVVLRGVSVTISRWHKLFLQIRKYLLSSSTTKILIDFRQGSKDRQKFRAGFLPKKSSVIISLQKFLIVLVSKLTFLKVAFRFIERNIFPEKNRAISQYFADYSPDLVFSTSVVSSLDIAFLKEADRRAVLTMAMPKTWDNIMNGYFRFVPDYFLVHNELAKDLVQKHQHIKPAKVGVVGMPQFDWYRRPEIVKSREEHWRSKGLDPAKAIIFFGSAGIWAANDHAVAELIYEWIAKNELAKPCQLFLRPHFSNVHDNVFKLLRGKKGVVVDDYKIINTFSDNWDPTIADTIDFTNSVTHCDIMINIGSTLSLDAACVDRPIINPAFGCSFQGGEDVTYPYQYGADHYQWVLAENATSLSFTPEELKKHLNEYLLHPEKQRAERKNLIDKLCYRVDGQASQRVVNVINHILAS